MAISSRGLPAALGYASHKILPCLNINLTASFRKFSIAGVVGTLSRIFTGSKAPEDYASRFAALGYDDDTLANSILAVMVGATVEFSQGQLPLLCPFVRVIYDVGLCRDDPRCELLPRTGDPCFSASDVEHRQALPGRSGRDARIRARSPT